MSDAPETIWTWLATSRDGCDVLRAADHPRLDGFPTVEYRRADLIMDDPRVVALVDALLECQAELDAYSRQEYPLDHPVHERYRKRDFDANPARIALAQLKEQKT